MKVAYMCYDTETTGLNASEDEIIELSMIPLGADFCEFAELPPLHLYVFPTKEPPDEVKEINGYNRQLWESRDAIEQHELAPTVAKWMRDMRVRRAIHLGHNVGFDKGFLEETFRRAGLSKDLRNFMSYHCLDTVGISIFVDQVKGGFAPSAGRKLTQLCERYGVPLKNAHTAIADCRATLQLFQKFAEVANPDFGTDKFAQFSRTYVSSGKHGEQRLLFGKYNDQVLQDVAEKDPGYLQWVIKNVSLTEEESETIRQALRFSAVSQTA